MTRFKALIANESDGAVTTELDDNDLMDGDPVFVRVADELESRIGPLITELSAEPDPRRSHGR